jgi:hypothetical protein
MIKYIQVSQNVLTTIPLEMKLIYYYDDWFLMQVIDHGHQNEIGEISVDFF